MKHEGTDSHLGSLMKAIHAFFWFGLSFWIRRTSFFLKSKLRDSGEPPGNDKGSRLVLPVQGTDIYTSVYPGCFACGKHDVLPSGHVILVVSNELNKRVYWLFATEEMLVVQIVECGAAGARV